MNIVWTPNAWEDDLYWQVNDQKRRTYQTIYKVGRYFFQAADGAYENFYCSVVLTRKKLTKRAAACWVKLN
jgi:hypothetical protein